MKVNIEENEAAFQAALLHYREFGDKESSQQMFNIVLAAATNIALSIYNKRHYIVAGTDLVDEKALDATIVIMRNILERGHNPRKLSSYCYLRVLAEVNRREDSHDRLVKQILAQNNSNNKVETDYGKYN